jgi:GNAT superfamily N-acetyltransferase
VIRLWSRPRSDLACRGVAEVALLAAGGRTVVSSLGWELEPAPRWSSGSLASWDGYTIRQLRGGETAAFQDMVRTGPPDPLTDEPVEGEVLALGAYFAGRPIGVLIGVGDGEGSRPTAQLVDLQVVPEHRRVGVGRSLLACFEAGAALGGYPTAVARHPTERFSPAFESLLGRAGWLPQRRWHRYRCDLTALADYWWRRDLHRLPSGFTVTPWHQLTAEEAAEIEELGRQGWYSRAVSPFEDDPETPAPLEVDEVASVALRCAGRVVGWVVCERWSAEVVYIASLFVSPALRANGLRRASLGGALMGESIERFVSDGAALAVFDVDPDVRGPRVYVSRFVAAACPTVEQEWRAWTKDVR